MASYEKAQLLVTVLIAPGFPAPQARFEVTEGSIHCK